MSDGLMPANQFMQSGAMVNIPLHELDKLKNAYTQLMDKYNELEQENNNLRASEKSIRIEVGQTEFETTHKVWDHYTNEYRTIIGENFNIKEIHAIGLEKFEQLSYKKAHEDLSNQIEAMRAERDKAVEELEFKSVRLEDKYVTKMNKLEEFEKQLDVREEQIDKQDPKALQRKLNLLTKRHEELKEKNKDLTSQILEAGVHAEKTDHELLDATTANSSLQKVVQELSAEVLEKERALDSLRSIIKIVIEAPLHIRLRNWKNYVSGLLKSKTAR